MTKEAPAVGTTERPTPMPINLYERHRAAARRILATRPDLGDSIAALVREAIERWDQDIAATPKRRAKR